MMELHRKRLPLRLTPRPGVSGFLSISTELTLEMGTASSTSCNNNDDSNDDDGRMRAQRRLQHDCFLWADGVFERKAESSQETAIVSATL